MPRAGLVRAQRTGVMFDGVTVAETLLRGWALPPVPVIGLLLSAVGYLAGARSVDHSYPLHPWPHRYTVCFLAGIAAVCVAILGPPGYYDDTYFYAHMTQHILLTMVAAPLLVLGAPVLLILRVAPRPMRRRWLMPAFRSGVLDWLTQPAVGWLAFVGIMVVSHVPVLYDYPLAHPLLHDYVEHPLYLASALIYFYPLLASTPGPRSVGHGVRVVSLFAMMIPTSITGFFIYAAGSVVYPFYAHTPRPFGPAPLTDQQLGGALMWSTSMILSAIWLCLAGQRWLRAEERRSRSVDREVAREVSVAAATNRDAT